MLCTKGFLSIDRLHHEKLTFTNAAAATCRVKWERMNVSWVDNGDYLEYSLKKTYQFVPEMSSGSEEDVLTMINIPLAVS